MLWLGLVGNCDFGGIYFCGVVSCIHDGRLSCSVVQITYCSSKVSQGLPAEVGSSGASSNEDRPVVALTSAGSSAAAGRLVFCTPTITPLPNSLRRIRVFCCGGCYSSCFCNANRFMRNYSPVHST